MVPRERLQTPSRCQDRTSSRLMLLSGDLPEANLKNFSACVVENA